MSDDQNQKKSKEYDIFVVNSIFPDAKSLFTSHRPIRELIDKAMIVLDTNALLVPYSIGKESLEQIQETYCKLVESEQLLIPGQVAREFASNRARRISELFQQFSRKQASVQTLQKGKYPLLASLDAYKETLRLEKEIDTLITEYRKALGGVLEHIREWAWNDPVSLMYSELLTGDVICDPPIEKEKVERELSRRKLHHIPPAYKDTGKEDSGVGDLLIWLTILEIGKSIKKDVIFVSSDQKPDWWLKGERQVLYPRFELVDEFRRASDGCAFHMILFSQFLDLYGASESTINEVREEEQKLAEELGQFWYSAPEEIVEGVLPDLAGDLVDSDEQVTGAMAMTNAFGYGLDDYEILNLEFADGKQQIKFRVRMWLSGDQDLDKPYCGDTVKVILSGMIKYFHHRWDLQSYEVESCEVNW